MVFGCHPPPIQLYKEKGTEQELARTERASFAFEGERERERMCQSQSTLSKYKEWDMKRDDG